MAWQHGHGVPCPRTQRISFWVLQRQGPAKVFPGAMKSMLQQDTGFAGLYLSSSLGFENQLSLRLVSLIWSGMDLMSCARD